MGRDNTSGSRPHSAGDVEVAADEAGGAVGAQSWFDLINRASNPPPALHGEQYRLQLFSLELPVLQSLVQEVLPDFDSRVHAP